MNKNKHLNLSERIQIEKSLNSSLSFRAIGRTIGKDPTSISKEIKGHMIFKKSGSFGHSFNNCKLRFSCTLTKLCEYCPSGKKLCRNCVICSKFCSYYEKETCPKLSVPPYVCNGCISRNKCSLEKHLYSATDAQREYELVRSESRLGISISEEEAAQLDSIISPLIKRGQSIHHICTCRKDLIMFSEKTIYNYVDSGIFSARNLDLPRKVRYRPRKKKETFKVDKKCRIGRTYQDYLAFVSANSDTPIVQIDSVEGQKGGKVLLTIHFVESQFMLAFLRDANNSESVINIFEKLYLELNPESFIRLFPVLLGDNGSEFSNPLSIEFDGQGSSRTRLFYCDPSAPYQKGAIENNHEFIRRILPKGSSFDDLSQSHIDLMMNHINSYKRKKLGNLSPYEVFRNFHSVDILNILNAKSILPEDIMLHPNLLK